MFNAVGYKGFRLYKPANFAKLQAKLNPKRSIELAGLQKEHKLLKSVSVHLHEDVTNLILKSCDLTCLKNSVRKFESFNGTEFQQESEHKSEVVVLTSRW